MQGSEGVLAIPHTIRQRSGQHVVAQVQDLEAAKLSGVGPVLGNSSREPAGDEACNKFPVHPLPLSPAMYY